jgi:hypothetical protein
MNFCWWLHGMRAMINNVFASAMKNAIDNARQCSKKNGIYVIYQ